MTVEAYLRSLVPGLNLKKEVLERAARSPQKEVFLEPLDLSDDIDVHTDIEYYKRLDYASSTVYYSVLGVFAGGGYSEQIGDVRISRSGDTITQSDRERYKAKGDTLRRKWGFDPESDASDNDGMFDATGLRR